MLPQQAVWNTLRDADDALRAMIGPDPPAGKDETVERLRAIHDECSGDLVRFRPAVTRALNIAEQLEWQGRGNAHGRYWGRRVHRRRLHPHWNH
jgi:hypothetical protein